MKKPEDFLFQLIKGMSSHEKRYFNLVSSVPGQKIPRKLILLFNAMDKQLIYDEIAIKNKFASDTYLEKKLSIAKLNLQNSLLKCLRNYHAFFNIDFRLRNFMADIEILFNKGHYDMCNKLIGRMKSIAARHEKWNWQCEAIQYERNVIMAQAYIKTTHDYSIQLQEEELFLLKKTENFYIYRSIINQIGCLTISEGRRTKEREVLLQLFNHPLLSNEKQALSVKAKIHYHYIKCYYFFNIVRDITSASVHARIRLSLIKQFLLETEEDSMLYLDGLYRCMLVDYECKDWDNFLPALQEIKVFLNKPVSGISQSVARIAFGYAYSMELNMYQRTGKFNEAVILTTEIEKGIKRYALYLNEEHYSVFYFGIAYSYFGAGHYRNALKWINKLINESDIAMRPDINCMARIINLIVHYELGNEELLQSLVKSTYIFLHKHKRLYKFEDVLLQFIRKKLASVIDHRELMDAFRELHTELKRVSEDPFENKQMEEFDLISWLESKIENRPFAEVVKAKASRK